MHTCIHCGTLLLLRRAALTIQCWGKHCMGPMGVSQKGRIYELYAAKIENLQLLQLLLSRYSLCNRFISINVYPFFIYPLQSFKVPFRVRLSPLVKLGAKAVNLPFLIVEWLQTNSLPPSARRIRPLDQTHVEPAWRPPPPPPLVGPANHSPAPRAPSPPPWPPTLMRTSSGMSRGGRANTQRSR